MKRIITVAMLVIAFTFALCGCKDTAKNVPDNPVTETESTLGGWQMVPHEAEELPEEAQKAFDKVKGKLSDGEYTPVSLLATQLVAGTNYCILCQVSSNDNGLEPKWTLVYIYADLQGNAQIMNTYDLYIGQHSQPKE